MKGSWFKMMLTKEALERMDLEELELLYQSVKAVLEKKKRANAEEFEFYFEASENTAKRKNPYIAKLFINNGKIERKFMDLERVYGKGVVTVYGNYTASVGDIIEKRKGGSWKNEYRYWYIVLPNGEEEVVADVSSSKEKQRVIEYMKGNITAEELLESESAVRK